MKPFGRFGWLVGARYTIGARRVTITRSPLAIVFVLVVVAGVVVVASETDYIERAWRTWCLGAVVAAIGALGATSIQWSPGRVLCTPDGIVWGERRIAAADVVRVSSHVVTARGCTDAYVAVELRAGTPLTVRVGRTLVAATRARLQATANDVAEAMQLVLHGAATKIASDRDASP